MRYEKGRRDETRRRIVDVASRRFREKGLAASGMAGIMGELGLTNGGFYAHFPSKAALEIVAIEEMLQDQAQLLASATAAGMTLAQMVAAYLTPAHRDEVAKGCASAALLPEVVRDGPLRDAYARRVDAIIETMAELIDAEPAVASARASALYASMIGTLQLSRAFSDPARSLAILKAGTEAALAIIR